MKTQMGDFSLTNQVMLTHAELMFCREHALTDRCYGYLVKLQFLLFACPSGFQIFPFTETDEISFSHSERKAVAAFLRMKGYRVVSEFDRRSAKLNGVRKGHIGIFVV